MELGWSDKIRASVQIKHWVKYIYIRKLSESRYLFIQPTKVKTIHSMIYLIRNTQCVKQYKHQQRAWFEPATLILYLIALLNDHCLHTTIAYWWIRFVHSLDDDAIRRRGWYSLVVTQQVLAIDYCASGSQAVGDHFIHTVIVWLCETRTQHAVTYSQTKTRTISTFSLKLPVTHINERTIGNTLTEALFADGWSVGRSVDRNK